ncbi:MAG: 2-oxoglutarate dehydrogenase subunit E1, partial [Chlamydiae bacterium]|nr:2-oxoglutarate dehydrogenase subunit E1 [Chlamydiota bacterium]
TPAESRSTLYCSDIAKSFDCPVFHVNAEDPDACVAASILAVEVRQKFGCDVFIDLCCYRKYGHNEGDEPAFTQPTQYKIIRSKKSIGNVYKEKLINLNILSIDKVAQIETEFKKLLLEHTSLVPSAMEGSFDPDDHYKNSEEIASEVPRCTKQHIADLVQAFSKVPDGFSLHPKIQRLFKDRVEMFSSDPSKKIIDWGAAEYLSFATILSDGVHIRLSGQDCQRGTFSQRHAVWVDQQNSSKYFPLQNLASSQAPFQVLNSPLSEYAVLGFELGYSMSHPKNLTIWEAQYGDFANTAQVIIDQYISASEQKWNVTSNLTILLPHGYEGQGPEHSSARMERYLQLAAQGNMIIVNCTTPAQYFHLLRRQAFLNNKKPLIVFSPKALLRLPQAQSCLSEIIDGSFSPVISDADIIDPKVVLFCSGKVYYDLLQEREKRGKSDTAIVRVEQLYPYPKKEIDGIISSYKNMEKMRWVQEEHANMGAWEYIRPYLQENSRSLQVHYSGRLRSAATAAGSYALHKKQYQKMMDEAFS